MMQFNPINVRPMSQQPNVNVAAAAQGVQQAYGGLANSFMNISGQIGQKIANDEARAYDMLKQNLANQQAEKMASIDNANAINRLNLSQQFAEKNAKMQNEFTAEQNRLNKEFQHGERISGQEFTSGQTEKQMQFDNYKFNKEIDLKLQQLAEEKKQFGMTYGLKAKELEQSVYANQLKAQENQLKAQQQQKNTEFNQVQSNVMAINKLGGTEKFVDDFSKYVGANKWFTDDIDEKSKNLMKQDINRALHENPEFGQMMLGAASDEKTMNTFLYNFYNQGGRKIKESWSPNPFTNTSTYIPIDKTGKQITPPEPAGFFDKAGDLYDRLFK